MKATDEQISAIREMHKDSNGKSKKVSHDLPVRVPGSHVTQAASWKMKIFLPSQLIKAWEREKGLHKRKPWAKHRGKKAS